MGRPKKGELSSIDKILALGDTSNMTASEIVEKAGVPMHSVYNAVRDNKIPGFKRLQPRMGGDFETYETVILNTIEDTRDLTAYEIAKKTGIPNSIIYNVISNYNIPYKRKNKIRKASSAENYRRPECHFYSDCLWTSAKSNARSVPCSGCDKYKPKETGMTIEDLKLELQSIARLLVAAGFKPKWRS